MKLENGMKEKIAKRNDIKNDKEKEEREGTEQFILATEQQSWQEAVDIIATKGSIRLIAV